MAAEPLRAVLDIYDPEGVGKAVFATEVSARRTPVLRQASWPTDAENLGDLSFAVDVDLWTYSAGRQTFERVLEIDGALVWLHLANGSLSASIAAPTKAAAIEGEVRLRKRFGETETEDRQTVPVLFWALGQHGPISARRRLDVPTWGDVADNYGTELRSTLSEVVAKFRPAHGGQLLLWHGAPGTGKTWALRSLAWEWRSWCDVEYIVDPDRFFGTDAAYLTQVLLQDDSPPPSDGAGDRWRLLVMEDAGELLTIDAHERVGKALSRFLNVVDGMIGQGLRVLVLITTNEELGRLHPAVARPGRAALELHFNPLDAAASRAWAAARGIQVETKPHTLADLYAIAEGFRDRRHGARPVGFQPRVAS